ncbi:lytic transglycosylase [Rhodobacter phage RcSimone-Hastad]|nr:lytic transglycosylase [Rhodobacter phage RcSimone-Hastad]
MRALATLALLAVLATPAVAQSGLASWYAEGHTTANGEPFRPDGLTCAHRSLPFGTRVEVTYNGRSAICRVNDRGPFIGGRVLDLSRGMARAIGLIHVGVARVSYRVL